MGGGRQLGTGGGRLGTPGGLAAGLVSAVLAAAWLLAAVPSAGAAPPWQTAQHMQDLLFDAQTALLLDEPRAGVRFAVRARRLGRGRLGRDVPARGPLAGGLRRDAPGAHAAVVAALADAERAARGGDEVGVAAARGRLRAALLRGSYAVTLAAVRAGDPRRARAWLLLREFRRATRFTRPGVDATVAVRALARGRMRPRRALLEVKQDLLDAYQARLLDYLADADEAAERGFGPRWAQTAAVAAGYWRVLAPEYERARGASARACHTRRASVYSRPLSVGILLPTRPTLLRRPPHAAMCVRHPRVQGQRL